MIGLLLSFCGVLRGFSLPRAIFTDFNIAPPTAFFLHSIEHFFCNDRLVIAFGDPESLSNFSLSILHTENAELRGYGLDMKVDSNKLQETANNNKSLQETH